VTKRDEFLGATDSEDWSTVERIAQDLDRAGYWQEPPEVDKQKHVREMIFRLSFGENPPGFTDVFHNRLMAGQHAFASTLMADESEELILVYKPVVNLTFAEVKEMAAQHEALDAYYEHRLPEAKYAFSAAEDLIEELTEETMGRAWPGVSTEERRRIVRAALIQYRQFEAAKRRFKARLIEEGFDLDRYTGDYLQAAGACRSNARLRYITEDFSEYLKLAVDLEAVNFVDFNLRMFLEAYMYTLYEFAEGEGTSMREAAQSFGGEFGEHVALLVEALSEQEWDPFDHTLDEHLRLAAVEQDEESGH
jgi:hypothetical protein